LSSGLSGSPRKGGKRLVLSIRGGGRARRIPAVPALPAGDGAILPAWKGSRTTVERAVRLIGSGALDHAPVEALAESLGVGVRHLTRLFDKHLGASPGQVARTTRVQRAKRLLDGIEFPITEIASQSGFRSLRRFNAVFAEVCKRPPTEIRRGQRNGHPLSAK